MDENEQLALTIYEESRDGQDAVLAAVKSGRLKNDSWSFCQDCDYLSPIYKNCCLVCGTSLDF